MKKTVFWMHGPFVRGFFARGSSEKDRVLMREKKKIGRQLSEMPQIIDKQ
jgi:hypothetical protein